MMIWHAIVQHVLYAIYFSLSLWGLHWVELRQRWTRISSSTQNAYTYVFYLACYIICVLKKERYRMWYVACIWLFHNRCRLQSRRCVSIEIFNIVTGIYLHFFELESVPPGWHAPRVCVLELLCVVCVHGESSRKEALLSVAVSFGLLGGRGCQAPTVLDMKEFSAVVVFHSWKAFLCCLSIHLGRSAGVMLGSSRVLRVSSSRVERFSVHKVQVDMACSYDRIALPHLHCTTAFPGISWVWCLFSRSLAKSRSAGTADESFDFQGPRSGFQVLRDASHEFQWLCQAWVFACLILFFHHLRSL